MRRVNLFAIIGVIFFVGSGRVLGQIEDTPPQILGSPFYIEKPVKVPLDNGGYKMVYKNNAGYTFRIIEYAPAGSMFQIVRMVKDSHVAGYGKEGRLYDVRIETYEDDPQKIGEVRRATSVTLTYGSRRPHMKTQRGAWKLTERNKPVNTPLRKARGSPRFVRARTSGF
jgi:hypothetical protein